MLLAYDIDESSASNLILILLAMCFWKFEIFFTEPGRSAVRAGSIKIFFNDSKVSDCSAVKSFLN